MNTLYVYSSSSSSSDSDAEWDREEDGREMVGKLIVSMGHTVVAGTPRHGGTSSNRRYTHRNREAAHERLMDNYFIPSPIEDTVTFRRRYRMHQPLFNRILEAVCLQDEYFRPTVDAVGRVGCTPHQKVTAALRVMAYGIPYDLVSESMTISQTTIRQSFLKFVRAITDVFGPEYLRRPTPADLRKLLRKGSRRGFPGMIGSLDCMHWVWQNCPMAEQAVYRGHYRVPTVILEAVAGYDTWIWHANFGIPGSNNDINVLDCSHLFDDMISGRNHRVKFTVNGIDYTIPYFLADGIYPQWSTLITTLHSPVLPHHKLFAARQEGYRKDVERAFGILKARWQIIKRPARYWRPIELGYIMKACIILHNMIVEDERPEDDGRDDPIDPEASTRRAEAEYEGVEPCPTGAAPSSLPEMNVRRNLLRDRNVNESLKTNLIEHIWIREGNPPLAPTY